MKSQPLDVLEAVYMLISRLPRYSHVTPRAQLPRNGIYLFFETGETACNRGAKIDRVVRIGTHKKDGRFPGRMREHYGPLSSLVGNKNGSVFRRHVGGALLRKENPDDPRLPEWIRQRGDRYPEVEEMVSRVLRENFTFVCFRVDTEEERLAMESVLIGLFSCNPSNMPSAAWLGQYAVNADVRRSGLWNTQHVDAEPLSVPGLSRLEELIRATLAEEVHR